ncbi:hypothetical protein Tco_0851332 [Tanacetum coccineum]
MMMMMFMVMAKEAKVGIMRNLKVQSDEAQLLTSRPASYPAARLDWSCRNEKEKRRGVDYVMNKILGIYKQCLELGPEYLTGLDGSSSSVIFDKESPFGTIGIHGSLDYTEK